MCHSPASKPPVEQLSALLHRPPVFPNSAHPKITDKLGCRRPYGPIYQSTEKNLLDKCVPYRRRHSNACLRLSPTGGLTFLFR
ncbi:hypothetical protein L596_001659 [Steinernema carpocapsae]|uniref:Uncharacterized protein n=1 Tax=Steinernema carpocapsae TaxID=34508 RepID=A0A4U8UM60_STECR|nr:hypothetical protein L596_001659 [Steinernema carpocapsae]